MASPRVRKRILLYALLALGANLVGVRGEQLFIVQTNITGAQTTLNSANSYAWNFTVPTPRTYDSVTAKFTLKTGPKTTADAVMTLWATGSSFDIASGTSIGSYAIPASSVSQSFTLLEFPVDTSATQLYGWYALSLTSTASTVSTFQWFIKGSKSGLQFLNENGAVITDIVDNGEVLPVVPEPSTGVLAAGCAGTFACIQVARRRRRDHGVLRAAPEPVGP